MQHEADPRDKPEASMVRNDERRSAVARHIATFGGPLPRIAAKEFLESQRDPVVMGGVATAKDEGELMKQQGKIQ